MGIQDGHLELVKRAMSGNEGALHKLSEIVQEPLRSYVLRIIFRDDLADDIVQETLLEMFKIFRQLKQADHFWPWLCKIALNKIRIHSRTQSRHRELLKDRADELTSRSPKLEGLTAAIQEEFKQCVFRAVSALSDRQKAVLSMRCYENMSYAQIAEVMGMSELGCRLLFIRAKKKLQQKLSSLGYGQKSLLLALVLFGKFTAPTEAAAAQICITPSLVSAGGVAVGIAWITSKTVLTLIAGGAVVAGTAALSSHLSDSQTTGSLPSSTVAKSPVSAYPTIIHEGYFFFPRGKQGPVLTRLIVHEENRLIQVLQNDTGNYHYDASQQIVTIVNQHYWKPDLSVMTLPTDSPGLESFLAQREGRKPKSHLITSNSLNLFVVTSDEEEQQPFPLGVKNYDALMEERFRYNWPARTKSIDLRDDLHKQGLCYFTLQGQVYGKNIEGNGQIPFVYTQAIEKPAWLKVTVDREGTLLDTPTGAARLNASGHPVTAYPAGTFLNGLNRPWIGLHTIDTVRRDAALFQIPFESGLDAEGRLGWVRLRSSEGNIEYTIDMESDLIRQVRLMDPADKEVGKISFSYLSSDAADSSRFIMPRLPLGIGPVKTESLHWLSTLAAGKLPSN